jgi:hypothetical protein
MPLLAEDRGKFEVIHIAVAQLAQHIGEHLARRTIDAFRDGLIRRDFREEL